MTPPPRETDHGRGQDHSRGAIRGGAAIMGSNAGRQLLRLGVTVVLARMLTPEEFGLVAVMTAIVAIVGVFMEIGLSVATVQREQVSQEALSTLFWINSGAGAALTLALVALSPVIASFFMRPELIALSCAVAATFLLNGLAVQHRALLQRNLQFQARAQINLVSAFIAGGVAIGLAAVGAGYWALVGQLLISDTIALLLLHRAVHFVPGRPRWSREIVEMLRFAIPLLGFNFVLSLAQNLCVALLGRASGAAAVGLYTRAFALAIIPQNLASGAAEHVALPRLAQFQGSPERFAVSYLLGVRTVLFVTLPVAVMFATAGEPIAHLVYGHQWGEVGALLSAFAPGLAVAPLLHSAGQIYLARGDSVRMFRWGVFGSVVIGVGTVCGLRWGALGVAAAWSATTLALLLPGLIYAFHGTPVSLRDVARAVSGIYVGGAVMAVVALTARALLADLPAWLQVPLILLPALITYVGGAWWFLGQRGLIETVLRQLLHRRAGGSA